MRVFEQNKHQTIEICIKGQKTRVNCYGSYGCLMLIFYIYIESVYVLIRYAFLLSNLFIFYFTDEEELVFSTSTAFERDANYHGTTYAKWKRQMLKEMGEDESGEDYYEDDINEVDEF